MTIIAVTRVGGDGAVLNRTVDTASREDAARWDHLTADAHLDAPPPYRPHPGEPVYHVDADGKAADISEQDLQGPLRELVTAVIAEGGNDSDLQPPPPRRGD
ncbi:MAG TPA: hypothetical protein VGM53_16535 [Streptosporangiaceae bacterium]|jgi:hypothetical protein